MKDWILPAIVIGAVLYMIYKYEKEEDDVGYYEPALAFGRPRRGQPKSYQERVASHRRRYGTTELPPRGSGLRR